MFINIRNKYKDGVDENSSCENVLESVLESVLFEGSQRRRGVSFAVGE